MRDEMLYIVEIHEEIFLISCADKGFQLPRDDSVLQKEIKTYQIACNK